MLQGGEGNVELRLSYLQKGVLAQLAAATGGIAVILEHRYYGTSMPTANLTTESYRFLTTEQALADQAYFAQHAVFKGLEHVKLTAPHTPYIAYGGSYAGALVAFLRIQYPDLYWGAISSSGVTQAILDYWEYYEPIRKYAPKECVDTHVKLINVIDNILASGNDTMINSLKSACNSSSITHNDDFAMMVSGSMNYWQSRNWDPVFNDPTFDQYCGNITSDTNLFLNNVPSSVAAEVPDMLMVGGLLNESAALHNRMINLLGWTAINNLKSCTNQTLNDCFDTHDASAAKYSDKRLSNYIQLSWPYQYCTEWGFLQSGSAVPQDQLPLISRLVTVPYSMRVCNHAFGILSLPRTDRINRYGGWDVKYPRLAVVGGEADPWRPATPLAPFSLSNKLDMTSTASEPKILIQAAIHHWEGNGVLANETTAELPPWPVAKAQAQIVQFVEEWMVEWKQHCLQTPGTCL